MMSLENQNRGESEEDVKKKEQLERNREIARNCRKRKRERTVALEEEVVKLRERNRELELKLKLKLNQLGKATTGRPGRDEVEEQKRIDQVGQMINLINTKKSYAKELMQRLNAYSETYSDFGEERRELVDVHLTQLKDLMNPTQVSKMLFWLLAQDPTFYEEESESSVWNMLCKDLKLDGRQQKKLLNIRSNEDSGSACKVLKMITALEHEIKDVMGKRKTKMDLLSQIITPVQQAKFLDWVEKNQACIHMLNSLWIKADIVTDEKELEELKNVAH